jgi:tetraacyldisaccharide 4'-kinase
MENISNKVQRYVLKLWYKKSKYNWFALILSPLSWLFKIITTCIRNYYVNKTAVSGAFIIVVGNITVGGAGKTPIVIALAKFLATKGFKVGVVSRGYKAKTKIFPYLLTVESTVDQAADEPWLIYNKLKLPVVIDPNRYRACQYMHDKLNIEVIIADDGLQHYKMPRDYEIAVIDSDRGIGNGLCLPAGPLRESSSVLSLLNAVCINNTTNGSCNNKLSNYYHYNIVTQQPIRIINQTTGLAPQKVHAVAGIGNPEKFFTSLRNIGMEIIPHIFPDHYSYKQQDIKFNDNLPVIMTEKDAVKCLAFADNNCWILPIEAYLPTELLKDILTCLHKKRELLSVNK